ncbi:hypothetical protein M406DRAFT_255078 [Cryphonectria parasitica EP155]|uniref:Zn(2)-C6 fungal-type domain-containing protein n=1 Tax=Cryphonectria parasitica (strain ATCC 38755 / EP155) TaxID=660469 RepID=A0A9P4Y275_CRYP1|nr:uncharacterized protein M406DRAFT_255078 [Cryphonectria parasitica EP155]KAF3765654.1 hypothetical protein M406DRAFT_255078 [Cryphonectria parasitica EP155]
MSPSISGSIRTVSETPHADDNSSPTTDPHSLGGDGDEDDPDDKNAEPGQPPRKRQRVRLSCLECRRRKLSCDRGYPCERCLKSGTPDRCTYESRPGLAPPPKPAGIPLSQYDGRLSLSNDSLVRKDGVRDFDRLRRLEMEVTQLKNLLAKSVGSDGSITLHDSPAAVQRPDPELVPENKLPEFMQYGHDADNEMRFFRGKEFRTRYFGPHNASMAFSQLTGLSPFMKETAEEWLKPLHVAARTKDKPGRKAELQAKYLMADHELEALLPSRMETDILVSVYLDQFEQLHRIVHIPSFKRQYDKFWVPNEVRPAAMTALVLSMMAVSSCMHSNTSSPPKFHGMVSSAHKTAEEWIAACEEWYRNQSHKHRRLIHYQIALLIYLAKRVNNIKKKRYWTHAGLLTREGISLGLHRDPDVMIGASRNISIFNQEMRRRLWATIQEFDFQAAFDNGLPTIISTLHMDAKPPRNINDDEFDEDSTELPDSRPITEYTAASFHHLCRQSLPLRLELSRLLAGPPDNLDYEQVIRYTNEITQEIDALPCWDTSASMEEDGSPKPLLAYTLLHVQLRQYIMPLHQPFLRMRKVNSKYQFSEVMFYNAARDMVLLHDKLTECGVRTLNFLREDALTLALNLTSVTMLQPRGSTNMIMVNSQHTLKLLDKCLQMKEDRILRCGNNEPWGYSIMCAAYGLLETHLGIKDSQTAKSSSAERFINLHYRLLAGQEPPQQHRQMAVAQQHGPQQNAAGGLQLRPEGPSLLERAKSITPFVHGPNHGGVPVQGAGGELQAAQPTLNPEFNMEVLGMNLNDLWAVDAWEAY